MSSVSFTCIISPVISEGVVTINWFDSYGGRLLQSNSTFTISNTAQLNDTSYISVLNIPSVSLAQNDTKYTCSFLIDANLSEYVVPSSGNISSSALRVEGIWSYI